MNAAGLTTEEINMYLKKDVVTQSMFIGTFPSDRNPPISTLPCAFVWNTAPSSSPGEHWVACYIDKQLRAWYFDSSGEPIPNMFKNYLSSYSPIRLVMKPVQHILSNLCGHYCVMFLILVCRGINPKRLLKALFCNNLSKNDFLVQKWFAKYKVSSQYK